MFNMVHNETRCLTSEIVEVAPFESLRGLFSTGAVLTPPMFEWTQKVFGERVHVISSSGGTDICGACKHFCIYQRSYFIESIVYFSRDVYRELASLRRRFAAY